MVIATTLDKGLAAKMYEQMLLIRRLEEKSAQLYMEGKIRGFLHLYIGQEAVAVGAMSVLREDDYIFTHYRDHGHAIARGVPPRGVMAELMGKVTGVSGGKGGSMHLFDVSRRFMGGYAIVGGQLPLAVGMALAVKQKKEDSIVVCFFGDGSVNEGEFHEAMNLASVWELPVLFYLENNLYGMGTHIDRTHSGGRDIYLVTQHYRMPSAQVDGMDLLAVREATREAVDKVRSTGRPVFLEAIAYRFRGHSMADPSSYRTKTELDGWRTKDPIVAFKKKAAEVGWLNEDETERISREVDSTIEDAVRFAEESDMPPPDALYQNVYTD